MRSKLLCFLVLILAAASATGQNTTGSIEGSVRDLNNTPIAQATVYAYTIDNMRRRITTTTDSNGQYAFRDLPPGSYQVHAYKESEGYADNFFSFFVNSRKGWRTARVQAGRTVRDVVIELGPKYATLKLYVRDEFDKPSGSSLTFIREDDPKRPYSRGGDLNGTVTMLVPAVPFRITVDKEGYRRWTSERLNPQPGQTINVTARLKRGQ